MSSEGFKALLHGCVFTFSSICLAYNILRWIEDHEPQNAINVGAYGMLSGFEVYQISQHWKADR